MIYIYTGELATLKLFRSESNNKGLKSAEFEGFMLIPSKFMENGSRIYFVPKKSKKNYFLSLLNKFCP